MSGPDYANRPAGQCWICNTPAFSSINGAWFCPDHQDEVLMLQLEIISMESGAPIEVVERLTYEAFADLMDQMGEDDD